MSAAQDSPTPKKRVRQKITQVQADSEDPASSKTFFFPPPPFFPFFSSFFFFLLGIYGTAQEKVIHCFFRTSLKVIWRLDMLNVTLGHFRMCFVVCLNFRCVDSVGNVAKPEKWTDFSGIPLGSQRQLGN